ncbi:hypothetical protein RQP54_03215 [Curvibacter sp. APW13]|uniref:hypothetical protein n=1 Tax=Curvibacter sp. APW13 TaxID=3077236 RepID=UPI0028E03C55|nr:hypothetical protein [Curvibacter sp. APW13]MDT8989864.1 hypothetical protein [Curvibacter sp. APW13]
MTTSVAHRFDRAKLRRLWSRLHASDAEPLPDTDRLTEAWCHFHSGQFEKAVALGLALGAQGHNVANKAACIHASYLEPSEKQRHAVFLDVARRAADDCGKDPHNASAHFWHGYALGRYSEGISVTKALAMGIGSKTKQALETSIALRPDRADAYVALAMFHADIIDKVGALIAHMTYGVRRDTGMALFSKALSLSPQSPYVLVACAQGRQMLESTGDDGGTQALYQHALRMQPADAHEALLLALAREQASV